MSDLDLITGASGFIGGYVTRRLIAEGRSLRIVCRKGSEEKIPPPLQGHPRVEIVHADLARLGERSQRDPIERAMKGVERVFHCAGHVSDWGTEETFRLLNVEATRVLLHCCDRATLRRFVHLSSIAAFGTPSPPSFDDSSPLGDGRDPYSKTKAEGERVVFEFHRKTGLPVTVIRPAVVYGLGGTWLEEPLRMIKKGKMFLLGGGKGTCHPCYIENLVEAILLAAEHPKAIAQAFIVADDDPISFREYFDSIAFLAADASGAEETPITHSIPLFAARAMASFFEMTARLTRSSKRPLLTHAAIDMVCTRA